MYQTASLGMEDKPKSTFLIPDGLTCSFFYAKAIDKAFRNQQSFCKSDKNWQSYCPFTIGALGLR